MQYGSMVVLLSCHPLLIVTATKFGLSYPELMLVMVAYTKMPLITYYFATVAKAMLLLSSDNELITSCRSFRFGLYLFRLMVAFRIEMDKQKINMPMSFGVDHQVEIPTKEEWDRQCHGMTVICLPVHLSPLELSNWQVQNQP
jgi:hypothetical protein